MKYIIKITIAAAILGCTMGLSSCSDEWLETESTQSVDGDVLYSTTDNIRLAINGISKVMIQQHNYYGQSFNGEGTMKHMYGEYPGQDLSYPYMSPGWYPIMNHSSTYTQNSSTIYDSYPWYYYYIIVSGANAVIECVDAAEGSQEEKDFLKAEALTFRAYAFFRISEIYCEPWIRSNNGSTDGIVLRTKEVANAGDETDMPLSTLAETYSQIYADLDEAISLYQSSGLTRAEMYSDASSDVCFPDEYVAHAIYARAALTKTDYSKALSEAKLAAAGHSLMSNSEYYSGFCEPNDEWIWGAYNDESETIWYYGWQLFMACNGYYASSYGINVCINRTLVEQFPDTDIRKGLFLTESTFLSDGESFADVIDNEGGSSTLGAFATNGSYNKANTYVRTIVPGAPEQNFAYASLKFQATGQPAIGCQPIFRSSEMYLIQAEANYQLGNTVDAQASLVALNATSGRDASYTCAKTGDDLLNEIKLYRRLELWGEGFSWFDCKRWGDAVVRPDIEEDGNFNSYISGSFGFNDDGTVDDAFWKWILPNKESDYNTAINYK